MFPAFIKKGMARTTPISTALTTRFTLKQSNTFHPVMVCSFTLSSDMIIPKRIIAAYFVGKFEQISIHLIIFQVH